MCGIAGIVRLDGRNVELSRLKSMTAAMSHRGPDGDGYWGADSEIGFAHLRLAIIDLATGDQPMSNEKETIQVIFNGEIYNYLDVKAELESLGYKFRTKSDTEVLIHAYEEWGSDMLSKLNGMFAFALYDVLNRKVFLARDRLGVKPLYYYLGNDILVFASEMGGMTASGLIPNEIDSVALDLYLHYQYIPSPYTIYRGVKKLSPSEFGEIDLYTKQFTKKKYWDINTQTPLNQSRTIDDWMEELDALLQNAVKIRLISDVPFGAFLSGGTDSGLIVAMMAGILNEPVKTFSIGLSGEQHDELPYARLIAEQYGTQHEEFQVSPEGLSLIPKISTHFGEPFADSSAVPTYYVSKIARSQVKMVLTGDGGDEMFAGYRRYSYLLNTMYGMPRKQGWKTKLRGLLSHFVKGISISPQMLNTKKSAPMTWQVIYDDAVSHFSLEERIALLGYSSGFSSSDYFTNQYTFPRSDSIVGSAQYCDLKSYLPGDVLVKVDRMSMANSIEVRSPLLDYRVAELAFSMPTKMKISEALPNGSKNKFILKELASRYLGRDYVYRPKEGFVIPISRWLREDQSGYLNDTLAASSSPVYDHLNKDYIQSMINAHRNGLGDYGTKLWNLLMLDGWLRYAYTA